MSSALRMVGKAITDRVQGDKPSPVRAFVVATVTGVATGAVTYRLLRSGDG